MICQDISYQSYHTVDGQNATKNFHLGSLKGCSTSYIIPHQLTKELSINSISWWMNPSQINSMFILYLPFFYHQCQYPLISCVFVSLIWLSCDGSVRDFPLPQVVYEGDPARHHGSHFVIVTSGDQDISPRQLVLWHLGRVFYSGETGGNGEEA